MDDRKLPPTRPTHDDDRPARVVLFMDLPDAPREAPLSINGQIWWTLREPPTRDPLP